MQQQALLSQAKITAVLTGIQWGKSTVGAVRQKVRMHRYTEEDDAFIIAAPSYKIMQQSTLPAFLNIMRGLGDYNRSDAVFRMTGGGICYMRTATEPDSVVGVTNVRGIWLDEGGKVSRYFWENLLARSAIRQCQIDVTSSPYTLNWVYKDIVRPKMRDPEAHPDVSLFQAASRDNPHFPQAEWDSNRLRMDPRRFKMMFGGEWDRPAGLVYDCFDEVENQCEPTVLPPGTRYFAGVDWGFAHPFVMKIRAVTPAGAHFGVAEFCRSGLTLADIVPIVRQRVQVHGVQLVYCDPSQPAHIEEFNRNGIKAVPANNEIRLGLDRHYELLKTRRLKYFKGMNPHTLDELESYHYPEDGELGQDENAKDRGPVKQNDDCMDAERYLSAMLHDTGEKRVPIVPGERKEETQFDRIIRLKSKRTTPKSENWS